jgi:hypothetical protein
MHWWRKGLLDRRQEPLHKRLHLQGIHLRNGEKKGGRGSIGWGVFLGQFKE